MGSTTQVEVLTRHFKNAGIVWFVRELRDDPVATARGSDTSAWRGLQVGSPRGLYGLHCY